jgi:hypothetical protein
LACEGPRVDYEDVTAAGDVETIHLGHELADPIEFTPPRGAADPPCYGEREMIRPLNALKHRERGLLAFKIAGGIILFLFALTMIFGEGKPEGEKKELRSANDVAIFPLATPSLASPGAMMAVVLLTENARISVSNQLVCAMLMLSVIIISFLLMLAAGFISRLIGDGGASIISRVMGLILASIATTNVLEGIKEYFR